MSVGPVPAAPQVPLPGVADPGPLLRLVPAHDHLWRLRAVEYDDGLEVRRYECTDCADVLYS